MSTHYFVGDRNQKGYYQSSSRRGTVMVHSHWPTPRQRPIKGIQNPMGIYARIRLCAVWTPPQNSIPSIFSLFQYHPRCHGVFPLPDSYADFYSDSYSDNMQKGSTWTNSNGHSDANLLWKLLKNPPYRYRYQCQIGYSTHLHRNTNWNINQNRFSGKSSAHYYISHLNRNQNSNWHRNRSRAVETHHQPVWTHHKRYK